MKIAQYILIIFFLVCTSITVAQENIIKRYEAQMERVEANYLKVMNQMNQMKIKLSIAVDPGKEAKENEKPGPAVKTDHSKMCIPDQFPVRGKVVITSPYGYRKDPFSGIRCFHSGVDIRARVNTPVYATASGIVTETGYDRRLGHYIRIKHSNKYETIYGHLNKFLVMKGGKVKRNQKIALSGSSGRSTGPHIHYQVSVNGRPINPNFLIKH